MGNRPVRQWREKRLRVCAACTLALCLALRAGEQSRKLKLVHMETSFGKLPAGARPDQVYFSPDGRHVATPVKRPDGALVWIDGVEGEAYEWVLPRSLVWSADG